MKTPRKAGTTGKATVADVAAHFANAPITPLKRDYDGTLEDYHRVYPYATRAEAIEAAGVEGEVFGVLQYFDAKGDVCNQKNLGYPGPRKKADIIGTSCERWAIRPKPIKPDPAAAKGAAPKPTAAKPKAPTQGATGASGPTRKAQVRDMLLSGDPLDLQALVDKWGCSKGAASALISDVRHMGYTVDKLEDGTYQMAKP